VVGSGRKEAAPRIHQTGHQPPRAETFEQGGAPQSRPILLPPDSISANPQQTASSNVAVAVGLGSRIDQSRGIPSARFFQG